MHTLNVYMYVRVYMLCIYVVYHDICCVHVCTYTYTRVYVYMLCDGSAVPALECGTGAVTEEMTLLVFVNVHGEAPYLPGFQAFYHLNKKEYIYMGWTGIRE